MIHLSNILSALLPDFLHESFMNNATREVVPNFFLSGVLS